MASELWPSRRIYKPEEFDLPIADSILIQRAQTASECRPADQDPEGNWGTVTEGFQLSLRFEREEYLVGEQDMVRALPSPDILHIVVCGDPSRNRIMTLWSGYAQPVTKKIELPANWDELLQKIRKHE